MGIKSQDNWNINHCVKRCADRDIACDSCIARYINGKLKYSHFRTLDSKSIQKRLKIQKGE